MPIFPTVPLVMIGHRGAAGHLPENTMASFEKAIEMGVHGLELDVQLSADGIPVVIHDPTLDRTTNASGPVGAHTLASLRRLDAGHRFESGGAFPFRDQGHRISTLSEVLDVFRDIPITIELKGESGPNLAHATADVIADLGAHDRVIVGSFETSLLNIIRRRLPGVLTNFGNTEVRNLFLLHKVGLHRLGPTPGDVMMIPRRYRDHELATVRFRKATRDLGLEMHIWTVNEPSEMHRMIDLGVDGILTDYPDRLLAIVSARFGDIS
jgi:glycerophosphoryl diester phosphodiesterase